MKIIITAILLISSHLAFNQLIVNNSDDCSKINTVLNHVKSVDFYGMIEISSEEISELGIRSYDLIYKLKDFDEAYALKSSNDEKYAYSVHFGKTVLYDSDAENNCKLLNENISLCLAEWSFVEDSITIDDGEMWLIITSYTYETEYCTIILSNEEELSSCKVSLSIYSKN